VNWYDQLFYSDDTVLNIFLTSEERREIERERLQRIAIRKKAKLQTYDFKAPSIFKRITDTYFTQINAEEI